MIEFRILSSEWSEALADFFASLKNARDEKYFHPHPLTMEEAEKRCNYSGKDLYYVCVEGERILGYAMLRGWDAGYEIPSLGIAVHPNMRSMGLGRALIYFLHVIARHKGVRKIRIKVYPDNRPALDLYKKIGYEFEVQEDNQYIGLMEL
ncbi:MAG: GNAT family N-acetyltransferase [Desulfobacteraceae bacterium]|nr:GNAT family N-acetyltransferase [Desulfobacteraceae bacterium]